ncbi:OmpA family protein [Ichthyenterobacterium magnum]|uniref:OmpA family protein n=1 Tax=Ichthyenterobacterium magnum TaxID=1230530 RepID=A0A420DX17_9FLAO|nr:OmpA family protein [Ichthyenterobacterium magnum]RKE98782.1 OmpA family protein [Ichthyenterobacterium magnum]
MKKLIIFFVLISQIIVAQKEVTHVVYFETDEFDVPSTEHYRLLLFLSEIETLDIQKISIYGFTDDRGSDSYNMVLSQNRANSIKTIFSNNEFDEDIITNVDGKGEILLKLVKEEDLHRIRGLNRKVEIIVKPYSPPRVKKVVTKKPDIKEVLKGEVKAGDKFTLDNILFKTGYSYLLPESKKTLEDVAKALLEREDIYFTIQGHVCCTKHSRDAIDRKTKKRNLSVARAKYIYDYLAKKGINKRRMKYVGMRRKFPLGGEPKYDRRVEILITYIGKNN